MANIIKMPQILKVDFKYERDHAIAHLKKIISESNIDIIRDKLINGIYKITCKSSGNYYQIWLYFDYMNYSTYISLDFKKMPAFKAMRFFCEMDNRLNFANEPIELSA